MTRIIRNLTLPELETLIDWAAAEGWNPGLTDAAAFYAADPKGFFGAFVEDQMVAGISSVAYDDAFGFIGLYICHPQWRGQGHGRAVWDAGMAYLGNRTIGLDGVPEQQANYASMGFVAAYQSIRMSGTLRPATVPPVEPRLTVDRIIAMDRQCFPTARPEFLTHWFAPPNQPHAIARQGELEGYGVLRPCRDARKLGPLFAPGTVAAINLLEQIEGPIHLDVPMHQTAWLAALEARGFVPGFRTARMYRGAPPAIDMTRVFAITSLELG